MPQALQQGVEQSENIPDDKERLGVSLADDVSIPPHPGTTGSKLVCLYLSVVGTATMDELNQTLDMQRLRLYPMLATLEADGLVERDGETFRSLTRTRN
jgi:predicted Rossmann fold nucleotide-binding protein DprA/Smf involved in DNA uptake